MAAWLRRSITAGVVATLVMDAAMLGAELAGGDAFASKRLSVGMIGRWAGGMLRGRWRHDDISSEPPWHGEAALGILTHYSTGVVLTGAFLVVSRRRRPPLAGAVAYGLATSVFPLLVMFPSMGYGFGGRRSGEGPRLLRIMVLGHAAFGLGIGLGARLACRRRP